mgnify:FL=1
MQLYCRSRIIIEVLTMWSFVIAEDLSLIISNLLCFSLCINLASPAYCACFILLQTHQSTNATNTCNPVFYAFASDLRFCILVPFSNTIHLGEKRKERKIC